MTAALTRTFSVLAASWLLIGAATAADPAAAPASPTYAVVSLIGDQFGIVTRRSDVGTRLDPNERTSLPVPDPVFDRIAADAVEKRADRGEARHAGPQARRSATRACSRCRRICWWKARNRTTCASRSMISLPRPAPPT